MCLTPLSSFVPKIRTPGLKLVACWNLWLRLLVGTIHLSALLSNTVSIKNRDRLGSSDSSSVVVVGVHQFFVNSFFGRGHSVLAHVHSARRHA